MRFFISWPTYLLFSIHARLVHIVRAKSIFLNYYKKKHSCRSLQHLVQNKNLNLKIICFKLLTPFVFSTIHKIILFQGQRIALSKFRYVLYDLWRNWRYQKAMEQNIGKFNLVKSVHWKRWEANQPKTYNSKWLKR